MDSRSYSTWWVRVHLDNEPPDPPPPDPAPSSGSLDHGIPNHGPPELQAIIQIIYHLSTTCTHSMHSHHGMDHLIPDPLLWTMEGPWKTWSPDTWATWSSDASQDYGPPDSTDPTLNMDHLTPPPPLHLVTDHLTLRVYELPEPILPHWTEWQTPVEILPSQGWEGCLRLVLSQCIIG